MGRRSAKGQQAQAQEYGDHFSERCNPASIHESIIVLLARLFDTNGTKEDE
jgi:hypothetical protein